MVAKEPCVGGCFFDKCQHDRVGVINVLDKNIG
jgi:hypothetical protein